MISFLIGFVIGLVTPSGVLLFLAAIHKHRLIKSITKKIEDQPQQQVMAPQFSAMVDQEQMQKILEVLRGKGPIN